MTTIPKNRIHLSEHWPILSSNENIVLTNSGDTVLCYKLELPEMFSLSKEDYTTIHDYWYRTIKTLPPDTYIHKQDVFLKKNYESDIKESDTFLQKSTQKHFKGREYFNHESYLFIGYCKDNILKTKNLYNPFKKIPSLEKIRKERGIDNQFTSEVQKSIDFLNSSRYIKAIPLKENEIDTLITDYFNGFDKEKFVDTDLEGKISTKSNDYNTVYVGNKIVGAFSINNIKQFPEKVDVYKKDLEFSSKKFEIFKGAADDFSFRLPYNHIYNQIIFIDDQIEEKKKLESKKRHLHGARGFSTDNEIASENIKEYLTELSKDETKRLVRGHTNVIYYAENNEEFEKCTNTISTIFRNLDYLPHYPGKNRLKEIYLKSLFTYSSRIFKNDLYKTELSIALTSFLNVTSYRNDDQGVLFSDRIFNVPVRRDIRDINKKRIKAWNFAVYGPTGEGKSVLMQHIFRQLNEQKYRIVIFDIGGSFKKLSYLQDKEKSVFFSYEKGQSLGLNPFYSEKGSIPDIEKLNDLADFVFKLWKPEKDFTNEYKVPLRNIIKSYFENISDNHSFPSLYHYIKKQQKTLLSDLEIEEKFFEIEDFILFCADYIETGEYGFLFDTSKDLSYKIEDKDLVVFEFSKATDDPVILSILMKMASIAVKKIIWEDKEREGLVFFDEMAKFIGYKSIRDTIVFYYQAIRKQNAAVGTALQSPAQLPDANDVNAMIDNTQVIYILFNEKGYQPIVDKFSLSEHQHNILKSIQSNLKAKNPYTEFALIIGKEIWVMRLELPKEAFYAYQTDGKEYGEIMSIFNQTNNMELAIKTYMN